MSLNEKFGRGGSSDVRKLSLPDVPDAKTLQKLLSDLSIATTGTQCDVSWQSGGAIFILSLIYSRQVARASWKLYRSKGIQQSLIWEHITNDISVVHGVITAEMRKQALVTQSQTRLPAVNKPGLIPAERRAVSINNNLSGKLRQLFIGAQDERIAGTSQSSLPAGKSQLSAKPVIGYIDLSPSRQFLQNLFVNKLGIFSYATFLFFLEREYYEAIENKNPITLVVFKATNLTAAKDTGSLAPPILQEIIKRIKHTQRKTDVLAQGEGNKFIVLLPETNSNGGKSFARRAEKALLKSSLSPGLSDNGIKFTFGLATLDKHCQTLPALLGFAEQALAKAEQRGNDIISDQDILSELSVDTQKHLDKPIDLAPTQKLVSELVSGGIFTYPAFLSFLEHEYYRCARKKRDLLIMLLKLRVYEETFDESLNMLPSPAFYEVIRRVGALLTKRDILAHYGDRNFVIMRSNTSVAQMQTFSKRAVQAITGEQWLTPECPSSSLRICTEICAVRAHETNPNLLGLVVVD